MPGRLFLTRSAAKIAADFGADPGADPGALAPRANMAPGQELLTFDGAFRQMRWGMIPVGRVNARGRPVMETIVNARAETVFAKSAFAGVARCLVPADGWYEWTGAKGRKQPWRLTRADGGLIAFAAICDMWKAPGGTEIFQVATVTCEPNAEVAKIHHRMGVILEPWAWETWLTGDLIAAHALCLPAPKGSIKIEKAEGVDWDGP